MKLSAPTTPVFIIAVVLALLATLSVLGVVPVFAPPFWVLFAGFVVLMVGNLFRGW
ncbi:MAG: hypothetical protein AAGE94_07295 [Acidobacteriota bacterium]